MGIRIVREVAVKHCLRNIVAECELDDALITAERAGYYGLTRRRFATTAARHAAAWIVGVAVLAVPIVPCLQAVRARFYVSLGQGTPLLRFLFPCGKAKGEGRGGPEGAAGLPAIPTPVGQVCNLSEQDAIPSCGKMAIPVKRLCANDIRKPGCWGG